MPWPRLLGLGFDGYVPKVGPDADEVLTSAPPLESIPAGVDLEATWDGTEPDDAPAAAHRVAVSTELLALYQRNARLEILLAAAEERADAAQREARMFAEAHRGALEAVDDYRGRVAYLEGEIEALHARVAELEARIESFRRVVRNGLDAIDAADLVAAIERRGVQRPVPAASVLVRGDDAGDHALKDTAQ